MFNGRYKHPTLTLEVKDNENPTIKAIRGLATLITTAANGLSCHAVIMLQNHRAVRERG